MLKIRYTQIRLRENNNQTKIPCFGFCLVATTYEISTGPHVAKHGPEPNNKPEINRENIILFNSFFLKIPLQ